MRKTLTDKKLRKEAPYFVSYLLISVHKSTSYRYAGLKLSSGFSCTLMAG